MYSTIIYISAVIIIFLTTIIYKNPSNALYYSTTLVVDKIME